jgi:hypothetical protein
MYARPNGQTKMTAFWDAAPYSLLEVVRRFKDTASVATIFLMMEAVAPLERRFTSTILHGATFQKAVILILAAVRK